jgi:hypothetical protein
MMSLHSNPQQWLARANRRKNVVSSGLFRFGFFDANSLAFFAASVGIPYGKCCVAKERERESGSLEKIVMGTIRV